MGLTKSFYAYCFQFNVQVSVFKNIISRVEEKVLEEQVSPLDSDKNR